MRTILVLLVLGLADFLLHQTALGGIFYLLPMFSWAYFSIHQSWPASWLVVASSVAVSVSLVINPGQLAFLIFSVVLLTRLVKGFGQMWWGMSLGFVNIWLICLSVFQNSIPLPTYVVAAVVNIGLIWLAALYVRREMQTRSYLH